jgi:hypothetical protein
MISRRSVPFGLRRSRVDDALIAILGAGGVAAFGFLIYTFTKVVAWTP